MQALGCEVAAINTVNFSMLQPALTYAVPASTSFTILRYSYRLLTEPGNHTGYRQFKGTRTSPEDIKDLYKGLTDSHLVDFDVLLSGYIPSAEALHEVSIIARDLKTKHEFMKPGSFFWILDPVMGDQGRLYVSQDLVQGYKNVIRGGQERPDLIVPNGFELELISGIYLSSNDNSDGAVLERRPTGDNYEATLSKVKEAIQVLHKRDGIKMVVTTSVRVHGKQGTLCVVGSEARTDGSARCFVIEVPVLDCYFSGTGDMFAGLMVGRLREACQAAGTLNNHGWATNNDETAAPDLPLAKATVKVLSSMGAVLDKTMKAMKQEMDKYQVSKRASLDARNTHRDDGDEEEETKSWFLARTKAAEVRAVRNARDLIYPGIRFEAVALD